MASTAAGRPPSDLERTYAVVLAKMAGVYLGRPVEGWDPERIRADHGDLTGFLPGTAITVSDDDLSGAFAFVRGLGEAGFPPDLTPTRVGEAWLDHLIDGRTTLWWGGIGSSNADMRTLPRGRRSMASGGRAGRSPRGPRCASVRGCTLWPVMTSRPSRVGRSHGSPRGASDFGPIP